MLNPFQFKSYIFTSISLLALIGCSDNTDSADVVSNNDTEITTERPEGWTDETHGKVDFSNYDKVFPQTSVPQLTIKLSSESWKAMIADMTENFGAFGSGGNQQRPEALQKTIASIATTETMAPPEEAYTACESLESGDACTVEGGPAGVCGINPGETRVACIPEDMQNPNEIIPEDIGGGTDNPIWVEATIEYDEKTWNHVGLRFKGNSTLQGGWSSGSYKLPLKLDFDEFEAEYPSIDDQRFFGFKKLALASNHKDDSYLRDKIAGDVFRENGVPAPKRAFWRVMIDTGSGESVYFGLYTMAEMPEESMLDEQYASSDGNVYKPDGAAVKWEEGVPLNDESFEKKNNEEEADWSDVENARSALHADRTDASLWRTNLDKYLDTDNFLRWLAINTAIQDWDTYGTMGHNYYMYSNPADNNRLSWIPWDHNESFSSTGREPLPLDLSTTGTDWPLINFLIADSVYNATYKAHLKEFLETTLSDAALKAKFQTAHDLIAPYVTGAEGEITGHTALTNTATFDNSVTTIHNHIDERISAVQKFLE